MKGDDVIHSYFRDGRTAPPTVLHVGMSIKWLRYQYAKAFLSCAWFDDCKELSNRSYVTVYENRLEFNYPLACCCFCTQDMVSTVYMDRPLLKNSAKAGPCSPICTHNNCMPTCCDACGEAVIIHDARCCCFAQHVIIPGLEDAEQVVNAIQQARGNALIPNRNQVAAVVTAPPAMVMK